MDKVKMTTPDGVTENIEKLGALFPAAVTEMRGEDGTLRKGIDFEMLKQLLSRDIVEGGERYEFSWVGKKAAMAEAARPTTETLRPVKADSRDWDTTENLYIEGDNLAALKILQESYLGKVKMIYIDPPYNTGNDFIYADDFMRTQDEENEQMGMYDEDENHLFKNTDSNGRFHSDWCSMMYSRLMLARNLLSEDGLIFISIDDNEQENLKKCCDEIFGSANFIGTLIRKVMEGGKSDSSGLAVEQEYCHVYGKNAPCGLYKKPSEHLDHYNKKDQYFEDRGYYYLKPLENGGLGYISSLDYPIAGPDNRAIYPGGFHGDNGYRWVWGKEKVERAIKKDMIVFTPSQKDPSKYKVYYKTYEKVDTDGNPAEKQLPYTTLYLDGYTNRQAVNDLKNLFNKTRVFDYPKPISFLKNIVAMSSKSNDIILDFFSGSGGIAQAVMQLNAEDGGHRKFIMVQLPEPCDEKSEAYKAGYKNICEIGKERIRRAGDAILKENDCWKSVSLNRNDGSKVGDYTPAKIVNTVNTNKGPVEMVDISKDLSKLDIGFRVFRVDSSNMRDVFYKPEEFTQTMLGEAVSNIKPDRTDLDLLYACLLDCGVPIHLPHTTTTVDGCTIHNVDNGALMACFDEHIPHSVIRAMAAEAPLQVIFRDSAFAADADKINVTEIFKNLSPDTKVRVI